ncbi:MAG: DUF1289 domain-containing protein [Piscirickettsiaceae bacterium]|nr:DUF1289 domain-containing protein [Piscirickettsiaceae bacterium]
MSIIPSPCIKNCCLDSDDICLGCLRSLEEIMLWGKPETTVEKKKEILVTISQRKQLRLAHPKQ